MENKENSCIYQKIGKQKVRLKTNKESSTKNDKIKENEENKENSTYILENRYVYLGLDTAHQANAFCTMYILMPYIGTRNALYVLK